MVCVIELDIWQRGDNRETEYEHVQSCIDATWQVYHELLEECRMLGTAFPVHCVLDRIGCIVVELGPGAVSLLRLMPCVRDIRESRLHQQLDAKM